MAADSDDRDRWSAWLHMVAVGGVLAFCGASFAWGPAKAVFVGAPAMVAVAVAGCVVVLSEDAHGDAQRLGALLARGQDLAWWCQIAVASGAVVLITAVASGVGPWCVFVVLAALALTTPPVRTEVRTWVENPAQGRMVGPFQVNQPPSDALNWPFGDGPVDVLQLPKRTADLDTTELCHLWRETYCTD